MTFGNLIGKAKMVFKKKVLGRAATLRVPKRSRIRKVRKVSSGAGKKIFMNLNQELAGK